MSAVQALSLVLLVVVLVVAIWRRMNIGVLALAAALPVLFLSGLDPKVMYQTFPGDLFVLIAGVSALFAHLERSGALAKVVEKVYATVGDRQALLPWTGFILAALLSTAGAFSTAPIAFLVPMVAHVGVRYRASFYLCELAVIIGANSAGLSPLNPTGATVRAAATKLHVTYSGWGLWAVSMVVATIVVLVLQGLNAVQRRRGRAFELVPAPAAASDDNRGSNNPGGDNKGSDNRDSGAVSAPNRAYMWSSGLGFVAFVLLVVVAKADVGVSAMCLVALLQIAFHPNERALLSRLPWSSMLLLCGLLTYLGLMQKIGTIDSIANVLHGLGAGIALVLVLAYLTAILCNIESSTLGVLGLMTPIVYTAFAHSPLTFWVTCAVTVPAALMVMNPIHVAGTLIISNSAVDQQEALFRRLLTLAVTLAIITPGLLAIIPIALL
ncbi:MAG TPA: SLC13 family permease [Pseudonocardia sp.]|nr:SLC13 family permease [Pseudonocardia sp.]